MFSRRDSQGDPDSAQKECNSMWNSRFHSNNSFAVSHDALCGLEYSNRLSGKALTLVPRDVVIKCGSHIIRRVVSEHARAS